MYSNGLSVHCLVQLMVYLRDCIAFLTTYKDKTYPILKTTLLLFHTSNIFVANLVTDAEFVKRQHYVNCFRSVNVAKLFDHGLASQVWCVFRQFNANGSSDIGWKQLPKRSTVG